MSQYRPCTFLTDRSTRTQEPHYRPFSFYYGERPAPRLKSRKMTITARREYETSESQNSTLFQTASSPDTTKRWFNETIIASEETFD